MQTEENRASTPRGRSHAAQPINWYPLISIGIAISGVFVGEMTDGRVGMAYLLCFFLIVLVYSYAAKLSTFTKVLLMTCVAASAIGLLVLILKGR
jgi:hypothetical protein